MTYLLPHKTAASRRLRLASISAGAAVILIVLMIWRVPSFFPGLFMSVARPFWRTEFSIQSGALGSPGQLLSENESLKRQLSDLQLSIASTSIEAILQENADLKAMLGRASTTPSVLAAVLSRPPFMPYDELIIDRGADDGIGSGTLVYSPEMVLIGRISALYSQTSAVTLFTSPGQKYNVLIGSSNVPAVAGGRGDGQYEAQVPHGSAIQAGDIVSDSSLNDLDFGVVVSVTADPSDPFDQVLFAPPINIYQLRWVLLDKADTMNKDSDTTKASGSKLPITVSKPRR